ncbi:MAG: hypothetical protein HY460_02490 [Parcubacteria group bacterium]|nr:hypothetical protein [Parcubacteria group bacterium]
MKKSFFILLAALLVGTSGTSVYFYLRARRAAEAPEESSEELRKIIERVSKLIVLPEDETPTLATVSDPEKLKDQLFFAKAKVGDKVLVYARARKAILYDPVNNKVVEVAPIAIGASASPNAP